MPEQDGVLVVDKTTGPTSHDVVAGVRRLFGMRRVGHCGTLDPLATGVLVVCLGVYTRLSDWLGQGDKVYETVFMLGAQSDTGDRMGTLQPSALPLPSPNQVEAALGAFQGVIQQVPPAYSAVKVEGVRSYQLARRQQSVALQARRVEVKALEILANEPPRLRLRLRCSRGTYIRSLAADLGAALGCGGYVQELRRLQVGSLGLENACTFNRLRALEAEGRLGQALVPVHRALGELRTWCLDEGEAQRFCRGAALQPTRAGLEDGEWAVYAGEARLLGIGVAAAGVLRPLRVFAAQAVLAEAGLGA